MRHTRDDAPTLQELRLDVVRQTRIKELAAEADARWASKQSFLDSPNVQQPVPAIGVKDPGGYAGPTGSAEKRGVRSAVESQSELAGSDVTKLKEDDELSESPGEAKKPAWKAAPSSAREEWQPKAWKPGPRKKK